MNIDSQRFKQSAQCIRLEAILLAALIGTALFSDPWITLTAISAAYLAAIPFSIRSYAKVKRARAMLAQTEPY